MSSWVNSIDQQTGLAFLGVAGVILACCIGEFRHRQRLLHDFLGRAAQKGLTSGQARLLVGLAGQESQYNPAALLISLRVFDRFVGRCVARFGQDRPRSCAKTLQELASIRAALGFDRLGPDQVMHTTRQLQRGQRLALWRVGNGSGERCCAMVVSRDEGGIGVVFLGNTAAEWRAGDEVVARMWHARKAEYRFRTRILKSALRESSAVLGHAEQVQRLQARRLFRWDTQFDIRLFPVPRAAYGDRENSGLDFANATPVEGVVTNISGGGFSSVVKSGVAAGTLMLVDPEFRGPFPLAGLACEVVAVAPGGRGRKLRLRFVDLPKRTESEIVRAIYRCQSWDRAPRDARRPAPHRGGRRAST